MKNTKTICSKSCFIHRGFTLTEVLLAVMIVGLIGIALASLTRSAAREGGVGQSKILLRNNLASFMRGLRNDLSKSSVVTPSGRLSDSLGTTPVELLRIGQNVRVDGTPIAMDPAHTDPAYITYCFKRGTDNENIVPSTAYRGGEIYRMESSEEYLDCEDATTSNQSQLVLSYVKYMPYDETYKYPVPFFVRDNEFISDREDTDLTKLFRLYLIVELNSTPVVNDVIEETFTGPMGY